MCDLQYEFDEFEAMVLFVLELDKRRHLYKFERGLNLTCKHATLPDKDIPDCDRHNNIVDFTYALWVHKRNKEQYEASLAYEGEQEIQEQP